MQHQPISDYRDFRLFYTDFVKHGKSSAAKPLWKRKYGKKTITLGESISVSKPEGYMTYGCAKPTDLTMELAEQSMIQVDYDTIYAKLVVFDDEAHLYLQYNQIIGSRLLAIVNLSTLPPEMFHEEEE